MQHLGVKYTQKSEIIKNRIDFQWRGTLCITEIYQQHSLARRLLLASSSRWEDYQWFLLPRTVWEGRWRQFESLTCQACHKQFTIETNGFKRGNDATDHYTTISLYAYSTWDLDGRLRTRQRSSLTPQKKIRRRDVFRMKRQSFKPFKEQSGMQKRY